jgi:DNA helicase-2/ATP-dependent DNA helicase PcrA
LLRKSNVGRAALAAPHFVGTIQSFVETFLARPYLRASGIAVEQVDNDAFASAAAAQYRGGFHHLRAALKMKRPAGSEGENIAYQFAEYGPDGKLTFGGYETGFKDPNKPAAEQLAKLKNELNARGIFRHGDMFYFAKRYLDECPWAVQVLRRRFPVLIIDEMQDTSPAQDALLNRIFAPGAVDVQRFGDVNQRI